MQSCLYNYKLKASQTFTMDCFPTQDEKEAYDYQLSADRKYIAFMSNYSKVCYASAPINPKLFTTS